jgi:hypothetical protein
MNERFRTSRNDREAIIKSPLPLFAKEGGRVRLIQRNLFPSPHSSPARGEDENAEG